MVVNGMAARMSTSRTPMQSDGMREISITLRIPATALMMSSRHTLKCCSLGNELVACAGEIHSTRN